MRRHLRGGTGGAPIPPPAGPVPTIKASASAGIDLGTTLTISVPTVADGDQMIMAVAYRGSNGTGASTPAGWTTVLAAQRRNSTTGAIAGWLHIFKRVASSEPASYNVTLPTSGTHIGAIITLNDADTGLPIAGSASSNGGNTASISSVSPGVVAGIAKTRVLRVVCGAVASGTLTYSWAGGSTEVLDAPQSTSGFAVATEAMLDPGPSGTRVATQSVSATWAAATVAIGPVP